MSTNQTLWDVFSSKRVRFSALLCLGGLIGLSLMAFLLRVPLGVSILIAVVLGCWGIAGAALEMIVRAVAHSRAPLTFRAREPYEFIRHKKGWINVAQITYVCIRAHGIEISQTDAMPFTLIGEEADQLAIYLDEISTPLAAFVTESQAKSLGGEIGKPEMELEHEGGQS